MSVTDLKSLSWPWFLDLLDSDPRKAAEGFSRFARKRFTSYPNSYLNSLSRDEQEDIIQDVIVGCIENNFSRLRGYQDIGKSFGGWLTRILVNKCKDYGRKSGREIREDDSNDDSNGNTVDTNCDPLPDPSIKAEYGELLEACRQVMKLLDVDCQIILELTAEGYSLDEIRIAIRAIDNENKMVSDRRSYCRKRLVKLLKDKGYNVEEWFRD